MFEEFREVAGEKVYRAVRTVLVIFLAFAVFSVITSAIKGTWPFSSAVKVVEKVTAAESIIYNYEWFYDQYNAIEAQRKNMEFMDNPVDRAGTRMVLNNMIAEYNAKSAEITRNLWKANDLPFKIEY